MCHLNQYIYLAIASTVFLSPKKLSHPPVLDIEYCRDNQIDITATTRISILNLSTMDSDLKKMAKKAASLKLAASFLRIPQAMRAAGFSDEDASNVSKQMHVRRALERLKQQQTDALPVGCTVSVPSRSPTATINGSSTTSSLSATLLSDEMIPSPPVLEEVRLTVGATTKAVRNKKKMNKWWSASLKVATKMYHNNGEPGGPSSEEIHQLMSKRFNGTAPGARTIRRYVNDYKLVGVSPVKQGSPGNIPPASFESLCVAVESYISIMQLNRRCGNDIGKKELAQIVNGVVDSDAVYKAKNYKLLRRISLYKGIDLLGGKMFSQEARRIQWTRHKYISMWFENWENQLVALGFATREHDGSKTITISDEQLARILNFDETALTLDGSGPGGVGGRPKAIFYNPHLPLVGKATSKEGATTTMITGSSAAGEAIPPHFQFSTTAQCDANEQCRMDAAVFFPNIRGKFGMDEAQYLGVSVGLNEKGGMDQAEFEKYIRNSILPLFPDACDLPGKRVMIKVDSGPGRLNVELCAELKLMGWYMYPGVPNTTAVTQETDRNYGPFKGQFRSNLGNLVDARIKAKKSVSLQPWLVGLVVFGGTDEETGYEIAQCAFSAGFSPDACKRAWEKVGAAPCTRACLSDPKVSKTLGDGEDEYYNAIQVANDLAVHSLNECGYNGNLLQAKLEKQREEDAPFTQPHSKERIEMLRKASTHGKKFLATRGSHVMNNDFFVAAELNLVQSEIEQLEREKRKRIAAMNTKEKAEKIMSKKSDIVASFQFDALPKADVDTLLRWHGIVPGKQMTPDTKFSHLRRIFESKKPPPEMERWSAEDEERLQNLRGKEISMEDTAVGRKKIVLEQQLSAATLSMSPTKWNQLVELRKRKYGEEGVTAAAEEVVGVADEVFGATEGV